MKAAKDTKWIISQDFNSLFDCHEYCKGCSTTILGKQNELLKSPSHHSLSTCYLTRRLAEHEKVHKTNNMHIGYCCGPCKLQHNI